MERIKILYKGKAVGVIAEKASVFGKIRGLMFKNSKTNNLLFEFGNENTHAIHSFFVGFNFLAVWLDSRNAVVDFAVVRPFRFHIQPKQKFKKLVEIPFNEGNKRIIAFFVGKGKT